MSAPKIGGTFVDLADLKAHVDLTDILGVDKILCPWHDDNNPSLHVYHDHLHCFSASCGMTADGITYLRKARNISFQEAVAILVDYAQARKIRKSTQVMGFVNPLLVTNSHYDLMNLPKWAPEWTYLTVTRGLLPYIVRSLKLGWTGRAYSIPHYANGSVCNIKYRIHPKMMEEGEPKYLGLTGRSFPFLYPWDYFRKMYNNVSTIFITEGEFDAMILLQEGLPALSVPSGAGTSWDRWVPFLRRFEHIYLAYDQDKPGHTAAHALNTSRGKHGRTVVELLEPTILHGLFWPEEWGKDVTDARERLIPKLRDMVSNA